MSQDQSLPHDAAMPPITLSEALSAADKQLAADGLMSAPIEWQQTEGSPVIKAVVDGRGLACPMPLLKTKVALRGTLLGESVYVVATDPNSQADIRAFCQQSQSAPHAETLKLLAATDMGCDDATKSTDTTDTIFHFIITKTGSN